jgi:hypothetical protein
VQFISKHNFVFSCTLCNENPEKFNFQLLFRVVKFKLTEARNDTMISERNMVDCMLIKFWDRWKEEQKKGED